MRAFIYLQTLALRLNTDKSRVVALEYAFLIAFVSIVAAVGMTAFADSLGAFFSKISTSLYNADQPLPPLAS